MTQTTNNLFVLTGQEEEQTPYEWDGMPEYIQDEKEAYHVMKVRFRNDEDIAAFAKLVGQPHINIKTKAIWHPQLDKEKTSLMQWIDGEDE